MGRRTKTTLFVMAAGITVLVVFAGPIVRMVRTTLQDRKVIEKLPAGYADDVSRMNKAQVAEIWDIPTDPKNAEEQLSKLLQRAQASGLHVSIAGARHSMGGQTIYPGGIAINMLPSKAMELDESKNLLHVQAGAKWADIIPYLDKHGRSVEVMQSDNSFTVGGSLSVNCHGWQYGRPPIASTVESFRLMKADGSVVRCSRSENQELFSLALGGYGLFGVIFDADLRVVPNERLRLEQYIVPLDQAMESFERKLRERPGVRMVYARMNITPHRMFDEVLVNMFYAERGPIPQLSDAGSRWLPRLIFRGSAGSASGKELRWSAETKIQTYLTGKIFSRNQLMNDNPEWYLDRSAETTDILHEYFLPRQNAGQFLTAARRIIRKHKGNLLNVTVRDVEADGDTFLRYASQHAVAFVMFFSQPRTASGDAHMQEMTQALIDAALEAEGRYYLPYRLHATTTQFRRAYPQANEFFRLKRRYDPQELLQNQFYLKYGKETATAK
jgi:FAD/FMN-containing dehydrogenase